MKKLILIISLVLLTACNSNISYDVNYSEAVKLTDEKSAIIIDVRTNDEYENGHIENAINIPLDEINNITSYISDKNTYIIVYCKSGNRSKNALELLKKIGYSNVYNLGAMSNWES